MCIIAVASEKNEVCGHFGHCETFEVFKAEEGKIITHESVPNPGHRPGFLPNFLHDLGVTTIISGGMGGGAVDIFNEHKIEVVLGASGSSETAALSYLNGTLTSSGSICHEHSH
jgi:predicted Fe-Mo cluster-binding NifX family protein